MRTPIIVSIVACTGVVSRAAALWTAAGYLLCVAVPGHRRGAPRGRHHGGAVSAELRAALRRVVDETASEADWQAIVAWIRAAPGEGRLDVVRATAQRVTGQFPQKTDRTPLARRLQ